MIRCFLILVSISLFLLNIDAFAQGISINTAGTAADTSAMLDVSSTTKGIRVPRMTASERTAIQLPATGLIVYQTDGTAGFYYNAGTPASSNWVLLVSSDNSGNQVGLGNIWIPATKDYRFNTPKTRRYKISPAELTSALPTVYDGRIDDGFSSSTVNGLNSIWAIGGSAGTEAYFTAALHLPDSSIITGFSAQLIKNGGSLQSIVELYRSSGSGYLSNNAQLIATASTVTSAGFVVTVSASSINSSYNVIDNTNYYYFIRWKGEQDTQNVRFNSATITYTILRTE